MGFHPIVKINYRSVKSDQDWSDAAEKAIDFLQADEEISGEIRERIIDYYKNTSKNGRYNDDYEMYTGMMVWSVVNKIEKILIIHFF